MQTDPIGYGDGMNMYNYVGSDPVNGRDPSGLNCGMMDDGTGDCVVTASKTRIVGFSSQSYFGGLVSAPLGDNRPSDAERRAMDIYKQFVALKDRPQKYPRADTGDNWCGTSKFDVFDGNWGLACKAHDECYSAPGAKKEACDAQLIVNIKEVCNANSSDQYSGACALAGITYGVGLILFGPKFRLCGFGRCSPTIVGPSRRAFDDAQRGSNR